MLLTIFFFFFTDFLASYDCLSKLCKRELKVTYTLYYSVDTMFLRNFLDFLKSPNPFKASVAILQCKSVDWLLCFGDTGFKCVN